MVNRVAPPSLRLPALPPVTLPPAGSPGASESLGAESLLGAHLRALQSVQQSLSALASSMASSPGAILGQRNWQYHNLLDRATATLSAGANRPIWQGSGTGWIESFRVRVNNPDMRLRIAMGYPGKNISEINVSPRELQADGHTRPTQTIQPYSTLYDDVSLLYGIAIDVPFPGHPFLDGVEIRLDNPLSVAMTVSVYQLRAIVVEPGPK